MKWHYTVAERFAAIVASGEIRAAVAHVPQGERPIVWFSTAPDWEPTANKMLKHRDGMIRVLNRSQTAEEGGGLVRIGVADETAPHNWQDLQELSGMSRREAKYLQKRAAELGSHPREWWGTFEPVPLSLWMAVEVYREGAWMAVSSRA